MKSYNKIKVFKPNSNTPKITFRKLSQQKWSRRKSLQKIIIRV